MFNGFLLKRSKFMINIVESMSTFALPEKSKDLLKEILTPELSYLVSLFKTHNFEIKIAGGAVRDLLMNITPHDVDFATDATPTEMKNLFISKNIRLINTNGESHGTITPRINDKENFEITTLRIDKVTDGRRAEVIFTKDWKIDAERRDLTINSMFLDMDGIVHDYFNGKADIDTRTVRFVGDPSQRIQEDYLRILRYFRFYGRIANNADDHLPETLNKIHKHGEGLQQVSGERIWTELRKIICGNFAPQILEKMKSCGIFKYLGLPEDADLTEIHNIFSVLQQNESHPGIIMSTMLHNKKDLETALKRLKFSNDDLIYMEFMISNKDTLYKVFTECVDDESILKYCKDKYIMQMGDQHKLKLCLLEYFKYINRIDLLKSFKEWTPPTFPIRGDILRNKWNIKGKELGKALQFLKLKWKESDYIKLSDELLNDEEIKYEFMKLNNL